MDGPVNNIMPSRKPINEEDEYRHIQSEDEMGTFSEEEDYLSAGIGEEHHCELLIAAVNGATEQDNVLDSQIRSPRMRPSPRFTRSRYASSSSTLPNSKSLSILND